MQEKDFCEYRKLSKELLKIQENYQIFKAKACCVPSKAQTGIPGGTDISDRTSMLAVKLVEIEKQIVEFNEKRLKKRKETKKRINGSRRYLNTNSYRKILYGSKDLARNCSWRFLRYFKQRHFAYEYKKIFRKAKGKKEKEICFMKRYAQKKIVEGILLETIRMTQKEGCILKVLEVDSNKSNPDVLRAILEKDKNCKDYLLEKIKSTGKYQEANLTIDEVNTILDNFICETQSDYQDYENSKILLVPIFYDGWKLPNENEIDIENLIANSKPGDYLLCRLSRSLKRDRFYCRYIKNITKNIHSGNGIEKREI